MRQAETFCCRLLLAIALAAVMPASGTAQIVRGTVVDSVTLTPMAGVIVTLFTAEGRLAAEGLTTESGSFALRAPAPGTYSVDAKRIGSKRASSPAVSLQQGETTNLRLAISPTAVSLPDVRVRSPNTCGVPVAEGHNLADLWEDTRAALTATRVTLEQHNFSATVVRYTRQLDPGNLSVRHENRSEEFGRISTQTFSSASSDELHRNGYVISQPDGTWLYHAPDANVLLSDTFLASHCFGVQRGKGSKSKLIGITFRPVSDRDKTDVIGTLWLDSGTHHLNSSDFRYTQLPNETRHDKVGGHLEFARLPTGAWIVRRWWLRMPLLSATVKPDLAGLPSISTIRVFGIQEEGGEVITATTADTAVKARKPPER